MDYSEDKGWHDARIVPYDTISYELQLWFSLWSGYFGTKAYKAKGEVVLFRPDENFKRLNNSCEALCIPR